MHVLDNECSQQLKQYIQQNRNTTIQLTEADNHSVNAAERAIQTAKNHIIAGFCTVNKDYPMQLWDICTANELACNQHDKLVAPNTNSHNKLRTTMTTILHMTRQQTQQYSAMPSLQTADLERYTPIKRDVFQSCLTVAINTSL